MLHSAHLQHLRRPQVSVANRISFARPDSELSFFYTYRPARRGGLKARTQLYSGMISGKKIMHGKQVHQGSQFLPHESFVIAPGEQVAIDFPGACDEAPTTCLALEISRERLAQIAERMHSQYGELEGYGPWQQQPDYLHVHHASATQSLLERLVSVYTENHPDRSLMIDLGVTELVVRMLRHQGREFLLQHCKEQPDASGISQVLDWLDSHLGEPLDIDFLCRLGCMSRSQLYQQFNRQLGCSPGELQQQLRVKAAARRLEAGEQVTDVCLDLGYSSPSHFSRRFKHFFGCTPSQYRGRQLGS